jgi:hypothetical protein
MSVSFEINDARDAPGAARVETPVMVERPKSARQARRSLLIRIFAFEWVRCKRGNTSFEENAYAFKVSVSHPEAMHVRQPVRNINQLKGT